MNIEQKFMQGHNLNAQFTLPAVRMIKLSYS